MLQFHVPVYENTTYIFSCRILRIECLVREDVQNSVLERYLAADRNIEQSSARPYHTEAVGGLTKLVRTQPMVFDDLIGVTKIADKVDYGTMRFSYESSEPATKLLQKNSL